MSDVTTEHAEEVLWTGSVSNWHYAGKWLLVVLLTGAVAASFFVNLELDATALLFSRGVLAAVAVILVIWIRMDRAARKYTITNRRVSVEYGLVGKNSNEMRIQDVRSINLTTAGLSGLAGIGRLEFSSAATDDAAVIFWNVPGAEKLRDLVRSLQT